MEVTSIDDGILTSNKSIDIDCWFLDIDKQELFFRRLQERLAKAMSFQFPEIELEKANNFIKEKIAQVISVKHDDFYFTNDCDGGEEKGVTPSDLYHLDVAFARGEKALVLRDIHFPVVDERLGFDYNELLTLFPSLHFVNCHFYCNSIKLGCSVVKARFEACRFHLSWKIEEGSGSEKDQALFTECCFAKGVSIELNELEQSPISEARAFFKDCVIHDFLVIRNMVTDIPVFANSIEYKAEVERFLVEGCEFQSRFAISNTSVIKRVEMTSTVFKDKFALIHCPIDQLVIKNVNFEGLADFYQSSFENFLIRKSIFRDFAGFEDCRFGSADEAKGSIIMRYVTYYSFINFRGAQFLLPLDLRNTNCSEAPNFLDCSFSTESRKGTDRESFRIIKHSFEVVGNRIEANHFYALEMEAYRRELRIGANKHGCHWKLWERLLVSLNYVLSRHGQSYWQPLLGVLVCSAIVAVQQANWRAGWVTWPSSTLKIIEPLATALNGWASGMVILRPLYAAFPGQEAFTLLMAVLLSTCVWHFLVAARRHHRR